MNNSHLAAPVRYELSATAKIMLKEKLLNLEETHLDYGCGWGGDVERLTSIGYKSTGFDPYYFPGNVQSTDVVTMGYVLNVIQDHEERRAALQHAWSLAKKRLIISSNVRGNGIDNGNITSIGTFTKFYNHVELKAYIQSTLGYEAHKIAKDKFVVYRDGRKFTPLHHDKVLEKVDNIKSEGWAAPFYTVIKGYCNDFKPRPGVDYVDSGEFPGRIRYYRLICKYKWLPGKNGQPVRVIHIRGGHNSEHMDWAINVLKRRNRIAELKFHCIEQSFLSEFIGFKNFDFLDTNNIKILR